MINETSDSSPNGTDLRATRVLVLGASGYVGTHLVPLLVARGATVRAAARRTAALLARSWPDVEIVDADAMDESSLDRVLKDIDVAYYLVHSMASGGDFPRRDRQAAGVFAAAAARAGVKRIIYLGGLQPAGKASVHLASRIETGVVLRSGTVPVTELRAGIVIGPGSVAFEVIRDLVLHLPLLVTPRWISSRSQPIALDDVLEYLARLPLLPETAGAVFDVGGPEVLSYEDMMRQFGEIAGRRPFIVPVAALTPALSSPLLELVTSVPANVARALLDGLEHDVRADDAAIRALIPMRLRNYRQAVRAALIAEKAIPAGTRWVEGSLSYRRDRSDFAFYAKQKSADALCDAPAADLWRTVASIGGEQGYFFLSRLWQVRGLVDRLLGGDGMRRRQRTATGLMVGDEVDFWRVAAIEPGRRLTLLAEVKLPGAAALEFEVISVGIDRSRLVVTAYFHPAGAPGLIYWHALAPVHALLFPGMAQAMAVSATTSASLVGPMRPVRSARSARSMSSIRSARSLRTSR